MCCGQLYQVLRSDIISIVAQHFALIPTKIVTGCQDILIPVILLSQTPNGSGLPPWNFLNLHWPNSSWKKEIKKKMTGPKRIQKIPTIIQFAQRLQADRVCGYWWDGRSSHFPRFSICLPTWIQDTPRQPNIGFYMTFSAVLRYQQRRPGPGDKLSASRG